MRSGRDFIRATEVTRAIAMMPSEVTASLHVPATSATTKYVNNTEKVVILLRLPVQQVNMCSDAASDRNTNLTVMKNGAPGS